MLLLRTCPVTFCPPHPTPRGYGITVAVEREGRGTPDYMRLITRVYGYNMSWTSKWKGSFTCLSVVGGVLCCAYLAVVSLTTKSNYEVRSLPAKLSLHSIVNESITDGVAAHQLESEPSVENSEMHLGLYSNKPSAYLLVLGYEEQLTLASHSLMQLAPLAADWHAQLVTPVVVGSHLFGIPGLVSPQARRRFNFDSTEESIGFEKLYDLQKLNGLFHSRVSPQLNMVSFEKFISYAPKDITLVHFNDASASYSDFHFTKHDAELVKAAVRKQNMHIANCTTVNSAVKLALDIEEHLNHHLSQSRAHNLEENKFKVVKALCLDPYLAYQSTHLWQRIKQTGTPGTIIFTVWRGCVFSRCSVHYVPKYSSYKRNPGLFRFAVFTESDFYPPPSPELLNHLHQPDIQKTAKAFLKRIGIRPPFLSIHVRSERIVIDGRKLYRPDYYVCCMTQLKILVDKIGKQYNEGHLLLITDEASQYGSDTCGDKNCESGTRAITALLKSFNWTIVSYDPGNTNGIRNSGYVSLIEMSMLSLGRKLILVGRGSFQELLQQKFLSQNKRSMADVYHICQNKHC